MPPNHPLLRRLIGTIRADALRDHQI